MNRLTNFSRSLIFSVVMFAISLVGCKKSGIGDGNTPDPYHNDGNLSATVAGTNWQAKSVYAVDSSNTIFIVAGSSTTSSSFPVIMLAFPDNTPEGSTINFNIGQMSMLYFYEDASNVFWAEPAIGGSGSLKINKFNKSTKRVEGTFSGTLKSTTAGSTTKSLSSGQFAINYR